jgi:hypothetical protein
MLDGNVTTAWSTLSEQRPDQYLRVRLGRPMLVSRISMEFPEPFYFPMRMRIVGERENGERMPLALDEDAAYDGLFASLLYEPRAARMDLDLTAPQEIVGFRIEIARRDPFRMPWSVGELRGYADR